MSQNEQATSTVLLNGEQAKSELTAIAQKVNNLKMRLIEANEAGDGKAFEKLSKELKNAQKEMKQMEKESFDLKNTLDNLSGASIKNLAKAKNELDKQLRSDAIVRNSKEWKELQAQLKSVKAEMSAVNAESSVGQVGMEKFSGGFRQMFAGAMAGIAALTGVYMALRKFMDLRMQLEDSQANLKALTGLGDTDIKWLTDYAKQLSITTTEAGIRITASSKEIMDGFTVIGSKRPELLKNKEAMAEVTKEALILAAAGKMDVKEAFEAVTASMNQFNLGADQSKRIINVLGAGALEGSAEINDLSGSMKNVGTVAANSNMSLEQTIAALEVLASKQLLGEEAGTKLRGALLKMKEAGVGYVSGAFNMRDAIVEINAKLKDKSGALERDAYMQKVFGIENITAGMILLDNVKSYDSLTKAITNTTVAEKQAQINTDTTSAKLKQATNNFNEAGMALVENLEPAMLGVTNVGVGLIKILVKYPALAIAIISAVSLLTIAYVTNTVAMMANALWTKLVAEATSLANSKMIQFFKTLMTNPYVAFGVAIAAVTILFYKMATAETDAEKAHKKLNESFRASEDAIASERVQIDILFNRLKIAKKGTEEYQTAKDAIMNKYGQYLKGLGDEKTALDNVALAYKTITDEAVKSAKARALADATKVAADDLTKTQGELKEKTKKLLDDKYGKDSYNSMRIYAQIEPVIDQGKGADALNKQFAKLFDKTTTKSIGGTITYQETENELNKLLDLGLYAKKIFDDVNKSAELKFGTKPKSGAIQPVVPDNNLSISPPPDTKDHKNELAAVDKWIAEEQIKFKKRHLDNLDSEEIYQKNLVNITKEALAWKMSIYKVGSKEYLDYKNQIADVDLKLHDDAEKISLKQMKSLNEQKLSLYLVFDTLTREEIQRRFDDGEDDENTYNNKILALNLGLAQAKAKVAKSNAEDIKNFKYKSNEERIAAELEANKEIETADKNLTEAQKAIQKKSIADRKQIDSEIAKIESNLGISDKQTKQKQYKTELEELNILYKEKLKNAKKNHEDEKKIQADWDKDKRRIAVKQAEEIASQVSEIASKAGELSSKIQEAETMSIDNKYAKQLAAAKKAGQDTTALEAQIEEEKKQVKKKYADVDFMITSAKIIASTALAVMKALETDGIAGPLLAAATGITGLAELAVANQQRQATQNLWTGGFTAPGDKYKPAGIVHAGEFVGNQDAVRSAPIRKVFNLIDHAQKTNTVARITNEDITRALAVRQGYTAGGFVASGGSSAGSTVNVDMSAIVATMQQTNAVNMALLSELQKGIIAKYKISGDDGVVKGIEKYNTMLKNAGK